MREERETVMEIILIRHGQSAGNALKGAEAVFTGQWDCDLTERGCEEAKALAGDPVFLGVDTYYVSDLRRTLQTARAFTDHELVLEPRIRERSLGEFEGRPIGEVKAEGRYARYFQDPAYMDFRTSFTVKAPGGESYGDVIHRVRPFLAELKQKNEKKVVVVTHFVVIRCMLMELKHLSREETLRQEVPHCRPIRVMV